MQRLFCPVTTGGGLCELHERPTEPAGRRPAPSSRPAGTVGRRGGQRARAASDVIERRGVAQRARESARHVLRTL